ncbi:MAG: acyl-CoA synthetase FdrA [Candidatus Cloacimonadaceae bacterium]|jgi:FdrA protein|nr:acyl-CoA synthetase FdrA [Candidatus Cloacimonadaceae bacterium]
MIIKTQIVAGKYLDSVKLMLISKELRQQDGVEDAVAILANPENREILAATDMLVDEIKAAAETDIVIVVKSKTDELGEAAISKAEQLINTPSRNQEASALKIRNLQAAVKNLPGANLCLISVAGKYATTEAEQALDAGLHVMIFSDNVSLEDELKLKQKAAAKGLLLMGPDCGTAIVNGCPLAFANKIPQGKIGIVSAAGTGLQEVSVAIANRGLGVSQAFGTGGRDGKKEIGGIMLSACLDYLIHDPATEVIIIIAKTPDPEVRNKLWQQISSTQKPVVVSFLKPVELPNLPNLYYFVSLAESAAKACAILRKDKTGQQAENMQNEQILPNLAPSRKYLAGLYSGGTLCYEAQELYHRYFDEYPLSNTPVSSEFLAKDVWNETADCIIDLGSDEFTVGRPHPMIDYNLRMKMLEHMAKRSDIGIIILDIVLGYGAHPDPAAEIIPVISGISADIPIICHVLGTSKDPQNADTVAEKLRDAGAKVFSSHLAAADYAIRTLVKHRRKG